MRANVSEAWHHLRGEEDTLMDLVINMALIINFNKEVSFKNAKNSKNTHTWESASSDLDSIKIKIRIFKLIAGGQFGIIQGKQWQMNHWSSE